MEMTEYLQSQKHRMNDDQKNLVNRISKMEKDGIETLPAEWDALVKIYMWCHMDSGSIAHRKFPKPGTPHKRR